MIDVNCFIGAYPFRHLPHPDADVLVRVHAREGVGGAWVGHLPSVFYRDPAPGNAALLEALAPHRPTLRAAPVVRPDWPGWERSLAALVSAGIRAVRAYPVHWGMGADDPAMRALGAACGEAGVALVLTTRFEDLRQRHLLDVAGDLSAAHVRALARGNRRTRIVVTSAGRDLVEEVHWGLTPPERALVFYDIAWIWGPPENQLAHLIRTIGGDRLLYGTAWPLRLTQAPRASLALLDDDVRDVALADPTAWDPVAW